MKLQLQCMILLLSLISLTSCGQTNKENRNHTQKNVQSINDSTKYAIIDFDTNDKWLFKNAKPAQLTTKDIYNLDSILNMCINVYNPRQQELYDSISKAHPDYNLKVQNFIIDLSRYNRQYIPVINDKGEKEVWVNCFCNSHYRDWRKQIISVRDGGNCYFQVKINLTQMKYFELMVNDSV